MSDDRPEYMYCITDNHADNKGQSWCGRKLVGWSFVDIDHAAMCGRNGGFQVACPECVEAVMKGLRNGHEPA